MFQIRKFKLLPECTPIKWARVLDRYSQSYIAQVVGQVQVVTLFGVWLERDWHAETLGSAGWLGLKPDSKTLRVQQFNVLADGLSGRREDPRRFSRVAERYSRLESRRESLCMRSRNTTQTL